MTVNRTKFKNGMTMTQTAELIKQLRQGSLSNDDYRWEAADRIEQLEAEVLTWQGHAKTAIWGDSEECKSLSAEVDRLVRSRNKWGQRYNKLLLKIRAGESGETDDPASWQLRMALDDANVKNDEAAARIKQLEAALDILQAAMTAKKPIPMAFKKAILEARAELEVHSIGHKSGSCPRERT